MPVLLSNINSNDIDHANISMSLFALMAWIMEFISTFALSVINATTWPAS